MPERVAMPFPAGYAIDQDIGSRCDAWSMGAVPDGVAVGQRISIFESFAADACARASRRRASGLANYGRIV